MGIEELLEGVKLKVAYEKRTSDVWLTLTAIEEYYKNKNLGNDPTIASLLKKVKEKVTQDINRGYQPQLDSILEQALQIEVKEFEENKLKKAKVSEIIGLLESVGYEGNVKDIKKYLANYLNKTYESIMNSGDKKIKSTLQLLFSVIFRHIENYLRKTQIKKLDKEVDKELKHIYAK